MKSMIVNEKVHQSIIDIKKELKLKSVNETLDKIVEEYINNRK
jgi:hypothetical protein